MSLIHVLRRQEDILLGSSATCIPLYFNLRDLDHSG